MTHQDGLLGTPGPSVQQPFPRLCTRTLTHRPGLAWRGPRGTCCRSWRPQRGDLGAQPVAAQKDPGTPRTQSGLGPGVLGGRGLGRGGDDGALGAQPAATQKDPGTPTTHSGRRGVGTKGRRPAARCPFGGGRSVLGSPGPPPSPSARGPSPLPARVPGVPSSLPARVPGRDPRLPEMAPGDPIGSRHYPPTER